jgi:TonB-linked SusC/RagA family outer membrane protein
MNWTAALLLAGFLHVSAAGYTQGKITLSLKKAPLQKVFAAIKSQSGYAVWYDMAILKNTTPVNIKVKDVSLEEALAIACKDQPLEFHITDKMIVITTKTDKPGNDPPEKIDVKGRVVNEKGEPLEGAAILIKGSNIGTQTDVNGDFEISSEFKNVELEVSYTGYKSQIVSTHGGTFLEIVLLLSNNPLDQVQVIAYGATSKRLNTGNVSTVTDSEIQKQPVSNPLAALEGHIAGVEIQQNTGMPGGSFSIKIRGQNSLRNSLTNNGNLPLYLIDGVPFPSTSLSSVYTSSANLQFGSPLSAVNPADIESIDILKDADATAIYGSRGSNGVVLITTKKGKNGKTKVGINAHTGIGQVAHRMQLLNTQEYLEMRNEAKANDQATPYSYDYDINGDWDSTRYTDWQKVLIGGHAVMNNLQASVSGGNANTQFLLGGGYLKETTVFPGDFADQKGSVHFNLNHTSENHRFKINASWNYLMDRNDLFPNDLTNLATSLPPDAPPLYNSNGQLNWQNGTWVNPVSLLERKYISTTNNLIGNLILSYQIAKCLLIRTSLGYNNISMQELSTVPIASLNPIYISQGSSQLANSNLHSWIAEPQAEYHNNLFHGAVSILAGMTFQQNRKSSQTLQATGFTDDALLANIQAASAINVIVADNSDYKYVGGFARINYNFQEKYLLNLTGRRDGSSRFGSNRQFANFGAAGTAWIFSNTSFVKNHLPFISFGKLRASYGITGSDQIGDYGFLDSYSPTAYPYQIAGLIPARLANSNYAWETNRKMEGAMELGFLNDQIFISAAYFRNRTSNQLVGYSLSEVTGFNSIQANLPAVVQNAGWEFEWTSTNIHTKYFSWSSSINLTIPNNKLIAYPNISASAYAYTYKVGESLFKKALFQSEGVDPQTGLYSYYDVDKNGSIDYPTDLQFLKSVGRRYYGGFENKVSYKNISLSFMFQFVDQTGYSYLQNYSSPGRFGNQPSVVLSRWRQSGDKTNIQQYTSSVTPAFFAYLNAYSSDLILSDASFIRLKNISISYDFPESFISKLHGQTFRLYGQAQNIFTLTHYKGLDPENQNSNVLPPLRVLTVGLQFNF